MTPQEQQLLQDLTAKINSTVLPDKDDQAEQFITQSLGRNPDAAYIMAQTILVQNYALDQAKQQIEQLTQQLQQQAQQPQKHTSFLGNLLGMNDSPAPPPPPAQQQYAPPPSYAAPQYAQPMQYGPPMQYAQPQSGGFLRSAMQTATGVAAGALAFEGIESLMHGFGNHAGYGSGFGGFDGGAGMNQPREEVVNNYYGDSNRETGNNQGGSFGDRLSQSDGGGSAQSSDLEDRRDNSAAFADSDSSVTDNDDTYADTSSNDSGDTSSDNFDPTGDDNSF